MPLKSLPPLSRAEESELFKTKLTKEAKDKLIRSNLGVLHKTRLRHFTGTDLEVDDLISEGIRGLLRAMETFDPGSGYRFMTFAEPWARSYMSTFVIRARQNGVTMTPAKAPLHMSLNVPVDPALGDCECIQAISIPAPPPTSRIGSLQLRTVLEQAGLRLSSIERHVLQRLYIDGDEPTLVEVGKEEGLCRERIRQIKAKALAKLREILSPMREELEQLALDEAGA